MNVSFIKILNNTKPSILMHILINLFKIELMSSVINSNEHSFIETTNLFLTDTDTTMNTIIVDYALLSKIFILTMWSPRHGVRIGVLRLFAKL